MHARTKCTLTRLYWPSKCLEHLVPSRDVTLAPTTGTAIALLGLKNLALKTEDDIRMFLLIRNCESLFLCISHLFVWAKA